MHRHSFENEFNLYANEISFSYKRMSTKTRLWKEVKGNSKMAPFTFRISLLSLKFAMFVHFLQL